jgi:hypothetical protein
MSKINQPAHYRGNNGMCANDVIRAYELNFALGNVIKYVLRAGKKPEQARADDLKKALWYLNDELNNTQPSDFRGLAARETAVVREYGAVKVPSEND